jgi:phosphatidylglycerol:prolipoprotein diacylglycerol transferase
VKPIPVAFHIGPLEVHTYGIGLAITFWFAYRYFARRLRAHGYPDHWLGRTFVWVIVFSIVGARAAHVVANWHLYAHNLGDIFAVWHGGLSSYGGLGLGIPAGFISARRGCPELRAAVAADIVAPVLAVAWAVGRLLGPQLMVAGGGRRTTAWYGMYYAGEVGKRVPVPILQAFECFVIWAIALQVERFIARRGGPLGVVATTVVTLYGLARFFDEYVWLPHGTGGVAVEVASLAFVGVGALFALWLVWRDRHAASSRTLTGEPGDPWVNTHRELAREAGAGGDGVGAGGGLAGAAGGGPGADGGGPAAGSTPVPSGGGSLPSA